MSISVGGFTLQTNNQKSPPLIPKERTRSRPLVPYIGKKYVVTMTDPDAPMPSFLHWLVVDDTEKMPYMPPAPPPGETHRYIITVWKRGTSQNSEIPAPISRQSFSPSTFAQRYGLIRSKTVSFKTK
jgi:phosphatidylethanolamine-binding protein (PEBP) family uncharacterized protein